MLYHTLLKELTLKIFLAFVIAVGFRFGLFSLYNIKCLFLWEIVYIRLKLLFWLSKYFLYIDQFTHNYGFRQMSGWILLCNDCHTNTNACICYIDFFWVGLINHHICVYTESGKAAELSYLGNYNCFTVQVFTKAGVHWVSVLKK